MPSIRSGFGSDFVLKSEKIGIGSTTPTSVFDVVGSIKGDFAVTGVATLTSYGGFVAQNQHINKASSIGFATVGLQTGAGIITSVQYYETETGFTDLGGVHHGDDQYFNTLSEDLIIDDGQILNITNTEMVGFTTIGEYDPHTHASYVCAGSLEQVSVTDHFSVPCGGSNDRQETPIEGTVRFNDDLNTLEFFNGNEWRQFTYNQGQSGRGVVAGGVNPSRTNSINYITISTLGNTQDFGDLITATSVRGSFSSSTRGLWGGGLDPSNPVSDEIDYVTIASAGNGIDFGNLSQARITYAGGLSSSTRGIWASGANPGKVTTIDYVEIATTGNALDFGDTEALSNVQATASPTRGYICGGNSGSGAVRTIRQITIASKGDSVDVAELSATSNSSTMASNSVRTVLFAGQSPVKDLTSMETFNLATAGNAVVFGDLSSIRMLSASVASSTRGVNISGRVDPSTNVNNMEYVTFSSLGDAIDFGDISEARHKFQGCSDSHGGLGGF